MSFAKPKEQVSFYASPAPEPFSGREERGSFVQRKERFGMLDGPRVEFTRSEEKAASFFAPPEEKALPWQK